MASSSGIRQGAGESGTASTATTTATAAHLLLTESVGRSALAAALQQGLGLASTAKTTGECAAACRGLPWFAGGWGGWLAPAGAKHCVLCE